MGISLGAFHCVNTKVQGTFGFSHAMPKKIQPKGVSRCTFEFYSISEVKEVMRMCLDKLGDNVSFRG